jgi:hypothetical protein
VNRARIAAYLLTHPWLIPAANDLRRRVAGCAETLAEAASLAVAEAPLA